MRETLAARLAAELMMIGLPAGGLADEVYGFIREGIRAFALFARNAPSREELARLTAGLRSVAGDDAVVAIDHEGGDVVRLRGLTSNLPSAMAVAATADRDLARRSARAAGSELRTLGINLNLAPVADVLAEPRNPVLGTRLYSDDPDTVAGFAASVVAGLDEAGVGSTAKHFPGHGATPIDSHVDLPEDSRSLEDLRHRDLVPFGAPGVLAADCLMMSHVWYSALEPSPVPATLSTRVVEIARKELGYDGVICTDCLTMGAIQRRFGTGQAAVQAIAAGCDLVAISESLDLQLEAWNALRAALTSGELPEGRAREAADRCSRLRRKLFLLSGREQPAADSGVQQEVAERSLTAVRWDAALGEAVRAAATVALISDDSAPSREAVEQVTALLTGRVCRVHPGHVPLEPQSTVPVLPESDLALVLSRRACWNPDWARRVRRAIAGARHVVVVAVGTPHDLLEFPEAHGWLATYDRGRASLRQAIEYAWEGGEAPGLLPVTLSPAYPRGFGLSRAYA